MKMYAIAVHYAKPDKKNVTGFRILDLDSGELKDYPYSAVEGVLAKKVAPIIGLEYDKSKRQIKGSNGALDRYPALINNKPANRSVVILNSIDDKGYQVSSFNGKIAYATRGEVVAFALKAGIANGKIVEKDGKKFISAITGSYTNIPFEKSGLAQRPRVKVKSEDVKLMQQQKQMNERKAARKPLMQVNKPRVVTGANVDPALLQRVDEITGQTVEQKMGYIMIALREVRPFCYAVFMCLNRVATLEVKTMGVSLRTLYFNPDFVLRESLPELLFIVIHEIYHVSMKHKIRKGSRRHSIWNKACDYYINKQIAEEFGLTKRGQVVFAKGVHKETKYKIALPEDGLYNSKVDVDKDSPERIYDELEEISRNNSQNNNGQQGDSQDQNQGQNQSQGGGSQGNNSQDSNDTNNNNSGSNQGKNSQEKKSQGQKQGQNGQEKNSNKQQGENNEQGENGEEGNQSSEGNNGDNSNNSNKNNNSNNDSGSNEDRNYLDDLADGKDPSENEPYSDDGSYDDGLDDNNNQNGNSNSQGNNNNSEEDDDYDEEESDENGNSNGNSNGNKQSNNNSGSNEESNSDDGDNLAGQNFRGQEIEDVEDDIVDNSEESGESSDRAEQIANSVLKRAASVCRQQQGHFGGDAGAWIERYVEKQLAPKVLWASLLRNKLTLASQKINTFAAPDKRFRSRGMVLPGPKKLESDTLENVKVCIDTSGSITEKDLGEALTQIEQLLKTFKAKAELLYWDTGVRAVYPFETIDDLINAKPAGNGGTDANCIFKYFEETREYKIGLKPKPKIIIVFTDGFFGDIDNKYSKYRDTIWVIKDNPSFKVPFGTKAQFKYDN